MASMLDALRELVSPAIISDAARQTGESEAALSSGFSAAVPTIATAIANRSGDHSFMKDLFTLAASTSVGASPPRAASGVAAPAIDTTTPSGAWLSGLFGKNLSGVVDSIARYTGMRSSSAASILSMCAPLVLGYIGKLIRSENLTVSDLADTFRDQRAQFASALPPGFELPSFLRTPAAAAHSVDTARRTAMRDRLEPARIDWAIPTMAVLAALGIGGVMWYMSHKPAPQARVEFREPASTAVGTAGSIGRSITRSLPGNVNITIPSGGAEDRLARYLASGAAGRTSVAVDRIGFDRGSAVLTPESREQLDNLAIILRAYPKAAVTVSGHTDNVGNDAANMALSKARAEAVASRFTGAGIATERVHAEGFGSSQPVASNATEEGRTQNRRVVLDVTVR